MSLLRLRPAFADAILDSFSVRRSRALSAAEANRQIKKLRRDQAERCVQYKRMSAHTHWPVATEDEIQEIAVSITRSLAQHNRKAVASASVDD